MSRQQFPVPFNLRFGRLDAVYLGGTWVIPEEKKSIAVIGVFPTFPPD
jgi:hypothetical protein